MLITYYNLTCSQIIDSKENGKARIKKDKKSMWLITYFI